MPRYRIKCRLRLRQSLFAAAPAHKIVHNHDHEQHHADAPGERIEHVDDRPERDHRSGEDADQRRHDDDDPLLRALVGGEAPPATTWPLFWRMTVSSVQGFRYPNCLFSSITIVCALSVS